MTIRVLHGDCLALLPTLAAGSVQCCVTSPPYYGLRSYLPDGHPDKHLEIGLEPTPDEYVAKMVTVFREVRRVLRDDGTLWLNIGDSYANDAKWGGRSGGKNGSAIGGEGFRLKRQTGLKEKDLIGIPWMLAFALRAPDYLGNIRREADRAWLAALVDGEGCITILETGSSHGSGTSFPPVLQIRMCDPECIAHAVAITGHGTLSPEQTPASVAGQRSVYHWRLNGRKAADTIAEFFPFLRIKRKQAIVAWNHQAVRDSYETKRGVKVPADALEKQRVCRDIIQRLNKREAVDLPSWMVEPPLPIGPGWYLRSDVIWAKPNPMPESVRDRPTSAHEHVFLLTKSARYFYDAEAIMEPSAPASINRLAQDVASQKGSMRANGGAKTNGPMRAVGDASRNARNVWTIATQPYSGAHFATMPPALAERCILAGSCPGDVVLDPFGGAGTTGLVADRLRRNAVLIELRDEYAAIGTDRITGDAPLLVNIA